MKNILTSAVVFAVTSAAVAEETGQTIVYAERGEIGTSIDIYITPQVTADEVCLAEAIYFEAGNQTVPGMTAVGQVILNRVASPHFPDTVCGVVHQGPLDGSEISLHRCQFTYFCDGKSDAYPVNDQPGEVKAARFSKAVASILIHEEVEDLSMGSTFYHASYVTPFWKDIFEPVAEVGMHVFYVAEAL
jgi:spore germination cell wall hydrolase CwlJ-like protein